LRTQSGEQDVQAVVHLTFLDDRLACPVGHGGAGVEQLAQLAALEGLEEAQLRAFPA
jgi:hypothetical protein